MNVMETAIKLNLCQKKKRLKDKQLEAILSFMSGNDVFISLPTGYSPDVCQKSAKSFFHNWQHSTLGLGRLID